MSNDAVGFGLGLAALAIGATMCVGVIAGTVYVYKNSQIWSAEITGKAKLAEAEYGSQARIEEARSKAAAAKLEGEAELTRAEYSAQANAALADGLGGSEGYLRYLYIRMLEEQGGGNGNSTVVYIPTEAGMPILEANRFSFE